jgi:hypothetical protein
MTPVNNPPIPPSEAMARHLVGQWSRVRVAEVALRVPRGEDGSRITVEACVHLGALLPADVVVELVPETDGRRHRPPLLSSVYPYHNDSYAYEVTLPAAELEALAGAVVRVMPAPDLAALAAVRPVVGRVPPLLSDVMTRPMGIP